MTVPDRPDAGPPPGNPRPPRLERERALSRSEPPVPGAPWLQQVFDHHDRIELAFAAVGAAVDGRGRRRAELELRALLAGHALAKELVLYPAMAMANQRMHATLAYIEQNSTKMHVAALETLDPMSQAYADKLEHVHDAVALQACQEESLWFRLLARVGDGALHARLDARYREEFERYMNAGARTRDHDDDWRDTGWP
jgi:hypothetical protein